MARELLRKVGAATAAIPRRPSGAPLWPDGIVGSISHDDEFAVALIAPGSACVNLGVDVEPALPLPSDILHFVVSPNELEQIAGDLLMARVVFSIKEAVYKATHPVDGNFLQHSDVAICLDSMTARTRFGAKLRVYYFSNPRIVAMAVLEEW